MVIGQIVLDVRKSIRERTAKIGMERARRTGRRMQRPKALELLPAERKHWKFGVMPAAALAGTRPADTKAEACGVYSRCARGAAKAPL